MAAVSGTKIQESYGALTVQSVEQPEQLTSVYETAHQWHISALGYWGCRPNEDFGTYHDDEVYTPQLALHTDKIVNYHKVVENALYAIKSKLGYLGDDKADFFKRHQILGAYDTSGRLQGVAVIKIKKLKDKEGNPLPPEVRIQSLVTAIWNISLPRPKREWRTQGVEACLLSKITQIIPPNSGTIVVEVSKQDKPLYELHHFKFEETESHKAMFGCYVMTMDRDKFTLVQELAKSQLVSKTDDDNKNT